jgi:hypothetical protein
MMSINGLSNSGYNDGEYLHRVCNGEFNEDVPELPAEDEDGHTVIMGPSCEATMLPLEALEDECEWLDPLSEDEDFSDAYESLFSDALITDTARRRWHLYTPGELSQVCAERNCGSYLIDGLIPRQSLSIVVGDSGVGKSPLFYQAAVCVASGLPFLGRAVTPGSVLYLDFENGLKDVEETVKNLQRHLGVDEPSLRDSLMLWNFITAGSDWKPSDLAQMVQDTKPIWIIIDSLGAFAPNIEEKASEVRNVYRSLREIIRTSTSITLVHHVRKPLEKTSPATRDLEDDPQGWLLQARGSRALINDCDVRIGVGLSNRSSRTSDQHGEICEVSLVLNGFARMTGKLPTMLVGRTLNEAGEPEGYCPLTGISLLFNSHQEETYRELGESFRFKDARMAYGKGSQATTDFLNKCLSLGILRKQAGKYWKVRIAGAGRVMLQMPCFQSHCALQQDRSWMDQVGVPLLLRAPPDSA